MANEKPETGYPLVKTLNILFFYCFNTHGLITALKLSTHHADLSSPLMQDLQPDTVRNPDESYT